MRNLLFFLVITLFSSCDQEIYSPSEIDFESNSLPEATVKKLNALLEDENGFLALNEIKLISFEISKSQNLPDLQIRKVILTRQNYLTREKENFNTRYNWSGWFIYGQIFIKQEFPCPWLGAKICNRKHV